MSHPIKPTEKDPLSELSDDERAACKRKFGTFGSSQTDDAAKCSAPATNPRPHAPHACRAARATVTTKTTARTAIIPTNTIASARAASNQTFSASCDTDNERFDDCNRM